MSGISTITSDLSHYFSNGTHSYPVLKDTLLTNTVAVVWHSTFNGISAHVSLAIDDNLYGFAFCTPTKEANSLIASCNNRNKMTNKKVTVQYFAVNEYQRDLIKALCLKDEFCCLSCIHAVSQILKIANVINVPFPINHLPETCAIYLEAASIFKLGHMWTNDCDKKSKIGSLFSQKSFGSTNPFIRPELIEFALLEALCFTVPVTVVNMLTLGCSQNLAHHIGVVSASIVAMKYFYSMGFLMKKTRDP